MAMTRRMFIGGAAGTACCGLFAATGGRSAAQETVLCGFGSPIGFDGVSDVQEAAPEAMQVVRLITDAVGIRPNFEVFSATFDNSSTALAAIRGGVRKIVYDADKFMFRDGRTTWRALAIMGHEIGHHLASHTASRLGEPHERELEADFFAGVAVSRMGGTLENAQSMTENMMDVDTATHPRRSCREEAIEAGWQHGEAMKNREDALCRADWVSEIFEADGQQCRMARTCSMGGDAVRMACRDDAGGWIWRR